MPQVTSKIKLLGKTTSGANVYTAIGDNQASVYGAEQSSDSFIVNIGTGSQISIIHDKYVTPPTSCEIRPYFDGKYLVLGCALCGGHSYKILKDFFNSLFPTENKITYDVMDKWAEEALSYDDTPTTAPLYRGTRSNPDLKASITNITTQNFNAQALTLSTLKGIHHVGPQTYIPTLPGVRGVKSSF